MPLKTWAINGPQSGVPGASYQDTPGMTDRAVHLSGKLLTGSVVFEGSDDGIIWTTLKTLTMVGTQLIATSKAYVRPVPTLPAGAQIGVFLLDHGGV